MAKHHAKLKPIFIENSHRMIDRSWSIYIDKVKERPKAYLPSINDLMIEKFGLQVLTNEPAEEALESLVMANQSGVSYFRFITRDKQDIQFTIGSQQFHTKGEYTADFFRFYYWLRHFTVGLTLRDQMAVSRICQITKKDFHHGVMDNNPFDDALMDFFGGVFNGAEDIEGRLREVMIKSDPKFIPQPVQEFAFLILLPFFNLMVMALTRVDEATYHKAWKEAVDSHNQYWNGSKQKRDAADGWVSLPIIAASSMIYDRKGYKLPEKSVYVPDWLVYGDFERPSCVGADFVEGEIESI